MVCPVCITAAIAANAPVIGAALGGAALGTRMVFARPRAAGAGAGAQAELACRRRRRRSEGVAPPPAKPPAVLFYSSFPERDDD